MPRTSRRHRSASPDALQLDEQPATRPVSAQTPEPSRHSAMVSSFLHLGTQRGCEGTILEAQSARGIRRACKATFTAALCPIPRAQKFASIRYCVSIFQYQQRGGFGTFGLPHPPGLHVRASPGSNMLQDTPLILKDKHRGHSSPIPFFSFSGWRLGQLSPYPVRT